MLKLAKDNSLILQSYIEMCKKFDLKSCESSANSVTGDLCMKEIAEKGFIIAE
jgi:hypothetical protein